jgi:hypothetical protein
MCRNFREIIFLQKKIFTLKIKEYLRIFAEVEGEWFFGSVLYELGKFKFQCIKIDTEALCAYCSCVVYFCEKKSIGLKGKKNQKKTDFSTNLKAFYVHNILTLSNV